jgi:hypothetical protein
MRFQSFPVVSYLTIHSRQTCLIPISGDVEGVTCVDNRIVILDLETSITGVQIDGEIPVTIKSLEKLEELYLQDNLLKGNIPASLATFTALITVDISNNQKSGVIQFVPAFYLIGVESNSDLSLDATAETPTVDPKKIIPNDESSNNLPMIVGICVAVILSILIVTFEKTHEGKGKTHRYGARATS